ncbi:YidC family membrane integrase SpoIIIJ [Bacillaceae bacterium Marseille-Q3522]|nr:YidC family membrane integrase SpoIIIJ [Bacillaceae bacterium Marseille-Q3522]
MKKRTLLITSLLLLVVFLSGCTEINQDITAESTGFWNKYIVYPLSLLILKTADLAWGSYGLSIIIVTILIRLVILPLMIKQTRSMKAMQMIQPELTELRKKYSSKDQKTQQKLQQETMALFQKNGVNPLAGCFPILIQMPILIGFYHAIMRTPQLKEEAAFLWFDLAARDPLFLLPLIAGATQFIQQKISMAGVSEQNPQMKMMLYIMPVMIIIFAINLPAALSLYWVIGNLFMIVQTYFISGPAAKKPATGKTGGAKK